MQLGVKLARNVQNKDRVRNHFLTGQFSPQLENFKLFLVLLIGEYLTLCGNRPGSIIDPMTGVSKEIDECVLMPQMCQNGICMNVPGSFKCECNRGYVYDEDAHQCIGIGSFICNFIKN